MPDNNTCERCGSPSPTITEWECYCSDCLAYFQRLDDKAADLAHYKSMLPEPCEDSAYHFNGPNRG